MHYVTPINDNTDREPTLCVFKRLKPTKNNFFQNKREITSKQNVLYSAFIATQTRKLIHTSKYKSRVL